MQPSYWFLMLLGRANPKSGENQLAFATSQALWAMDTRSRIVDERTGYEQPALHHRERWRDFLDAPLPEPRPRLDEVLALYLCDSFCHAPSTSGPRFPFMG
jgi:hypothetical protein